MKLSSFSSVVLLSISLLIISIILVCPHTSASSFEVRPSASKFAVYNDDNVNTSGRNAKGLGQREASIVRTNGNNCKQWPGSPFTCDMCCDGRCCEDPQYWTRKETFDNAQSWIPVRIVYVIPTSLNQTLLPSDQQVKSLFSRANNAFGYFPFRFLFSTSSIIQDNTLHGHCTTDPCFTSSNCGFLRTLLPAMKLRVDNEIVVTVCDGIKYLGESQFPWGAPQFQYVELQLRSFAQQYPYIVHELAHYTGLMHVFEGSCGSKGDWVDDTAAASRPSTSCFNTHSDTCHSIKGLDDTRNFMNYGLYWQCGLSFTEGQRLRSISAMENYRPTLIRNTKVMLNRTWSDVEKILDHSRKHGGGNNISVTTTNSSSMKIPACSMNAASFEDCWCEVPELDPRSFCKEVASDGKLFYSGETFAPRAQDEGNTGLFGYRRSTVVESTIVVIALFIILSMVAMWLNKEVTKFTLSSSRMQQIEDDGSSNDDGEVTTTRPGDKGDNSAVEME